METTPQPPTPAVHEQAARTAQVVGQYLADVPTPYLVMGVGVPGSGKSTVLEQVAQQVDAQLVCPDAIRQELTGDMADQSANTEVFGEAARRARISLEMGRQVVLDATNTHPEYRAKTLETYRSYGAAAVVAVVFNTPLEVAQQRNAQRSRVVPPAVIEHMHQSLHAQLPSQAEGFSTVLMVQPSGQVEPVQGSAAQ